MTTPIETADVVLISERDYRVLVIRRSYDSDAYPGRTALPGGHIDPGETPEQAARRELLEETGIAAPDTLVHIGRFDEPSRDPRGPYASEVFAAFVPAITRATAADDAVEARWAPVYELLANPTRLAFDHFLILATAVYKLYSNGVEA